MTGRDRDERGRARSGRPRDVAGRPLPRDSAGFPELPEPGPLDAETALAGADRLLAEGRPFAAHEVLEAMWKQARAASGRAAEVGFWRAAAQLAVGLTHLQRGNAAGAAALLTRAAEGLSAYAEGHLHGADPAALAADARQLVALLDAEGLAAAQAAGETQRLRAQTGG